jgi:hypothetical protein
MLYKIFKNLLMILYFQVAFLHSNPALSREEKAKAYTVYQNLIFTPNSHFLDYTVKYL